MIQGRRRANQPGRRVRREPPRRRRARFHHAHTLAGTLGLTALGTLVPGCGMVVAGRRGLGLVLVVISFGALGLLGFAARDRQALIDAALDPDKLMVVALSSFGVLLVLVLIVVLTYRMVRRPRAPDRDRAIELVFVVALCLVVASPFAVGARYAVLQRDLVKTVFADSGVVADDEDPWEGDERVNVLLLGGDGGVHRVGIRTDSVMVASIEPATGETVLFGLPRNLAEVPFPEGSELDELYPEGFTGEGDPLEWMLNAVYGKVPELNPDVFAGEDNPGAEAVKQAASGALGIDVDYYMLVNLHGFREVVDAIGGVTVNINEPIPIGGNSDLGIPPEDYLDPGPSQHLDGFDALWFARGRYGLDDYNRMERQRCVVDALVDEVDPITVLRRYEALAAAGKEIMRTDIPQDLVPAFVELGMDRRDSDIKSVVFRYSDQFDPNNPDYAWMQRKVDRTLEADDSGKPKKPRRSPSEAPATPSAEPTTGAGGEKSDPCAYHPVG
jgi:polyisoprenyl-teichoic acid--peptidoglycan teichoic acid transferase